MTTLVVKYDEPFYDYHCPKCGKIVAHLHEKTLNYLRVPVQCGYCGELFNEAEKKS